MAYPKNKSKKLLNRPLLQPKELNLLNRLFMVSPGKLLKHENPLLFDAVSLCSSKDRDDFWQKLKPALNLIPD